MENSLKTLYINVNNKICCFYQLIKCSHNKHIHMFNHVFISVTLKKISLHKNIIGTMESNIFYLTKIK